VNLLAWVRAPFAWKVVRQHDCYTYSENAVTGQRSCRWDGSGWGHIDCSLCARGMSPTGRSAVRSVGGRTASIDLAAGASRQAAGAQRSTAGSFRITHSPIRASAASD
jgi:hypothetical protein